MAEAAGATVEASAFRQVLGHFATGVTVVTGMAPNGAPVGLSVNAFTSVSLDPPLVAFCVSHLSRTWPLIRERGHFCVSILGADQEQVSRTFATPGARRFEGTGWRPSPSGSPIIDGALAWIDAHVEAEHPAGDHLLVVGRVDDLAVVHEGSPLVFYRGGYGRFHS